VSITGSDQGAEPDNDHGGLGVADFAKRSVTAALREAIRLIPRSKRRLLFFASAIQISLGLLDLLGIALIGLVAAVAVSGIDESALPAAAQTVMGWFGIEDASVSKTTVIIAGLAVVILIGKTALSAIMSRRIMVFLANRQADLSVRLARSFLSRPLMEVQRWTTSEAVYALGPGVASATVLLLSAAITIASELFLFTIVGVSLLAYDPLTTLIAVGLFFLVGIGLQRVLGRWSARTAQIMTDSSISTLTAVSEALATYRETTVLDRRDLYLAKYEDLATRTARAGATTSYIMEIPKYVLEAALYFGVVFLAIIQFLTNDWASAAATTAIFLAAGSRVTPALLRLQGAGITIRNAAVQAQPTFYMAKFLGLTLDDSESKVTPAIPVSVERLHRHIATGYPDFVADIEISNVALTYQDAAAPALIDVSFTAPMGASIALVGPTGAGKSTLADVILGVLEPQIGVARISGIAPREAIERWPGAISYVPQNVALVIGSVRENVALGLPAALIDDELVWEALHRAHLADFLTDSREGLDTAVGERGFRLSGGQRQRLGIARALYTRPKLLVLDEATSALDAETEQAIIQTLDELEGEVTTVTVAHRLATVRRADLLLYIRDGRVQAQGTFEEVRGRVPDFDRSASLLGL
jgi:ABC-type bacteriocin/lantibiotic exporter with double-glycine peptidase domain